MSKAVPPKTVLVALNESPSEKEGKYTHAHMHIRTHTPLNESPSEKEGKCSKSKKKKKK